MDSQPEINEKMRAILVDWLIEVHNIVDRYLASKSVMRRELQLVGISAMLMASKYEEIWAQRSMTLCASQTGLIQMSKC